MPAKQNEWRQRKQGTYPLPSFTTVSTPCKAYLDDHKKLHHWIMKYFSSQSDIMVSECFHVLHYLTSPLPEACICFENMPVYGLPLSVVVSVLESCVCIESMFVYMAFHYLCSTSLCCRGKIARLGEVCLW